MSGPSEWRAPGFWNPVELLRELGQRVPGPEATEQFMAMTGVPMMLQQLLDTFSRKLIGKSLTFGAGEERVQFTLASVDAALDPIAASTGQVDAVEVVADDLVWKQREFTRASASLHNLHVRPGARPKVVCAPVDLSLWPDTLWLSRELKGRNPALSLSRRDDGQYVVDVGRSHPFLTVTLTVELEEQTLVVKPVVVSGGRVRWRLPAFLSRVLARKMSIRLPNGVRLRGVETTEHGARLDVRIDELRFDWSKAMSASSGAVQ